MDYGVQMYCLRDITKNSMRMALEETAKMGYKYVEFAGLFDYMPEQIKHWLDEFGLICSGTHTKLDMLTTENIEKTIEIHKILGCTNLIVPSADWSDEEHMNANINALNRAQKELAKAGITLGYHNHSKEFFKTPYGKVIEEEIANRTSVELEIDTFWAFNALGDSIPTLEKYKNRIRVIHLKDGIPAAEENHNYENCHAGVVGLSVGSGKAPVTRVREWAIANGVKMVIESEGCKPTGLEEIGRCIEFLKGLEK